MIVRCRRPGPLHQSLPRSDTLFGALCWAVRWVDGEKSLVELLDRFETGQAPFVLSSGFAYAGDTRPVYYLPMPPVRWPPLPQEPTLEQIQSMKRLRKISYLSHSLFQDLASGRATVESLIGQIAADQKSSYAYKADELLPHIESASVPHNSIDRLAGRVRAGLFRRDLLRITQGGWYFLLRAADGATAGRLLRAVEFLGLRGVGGDTSTGCGHFQPEIEESDEAVLGPGNSPAGRLITLSLLHPSEADHAHFQRSREGMRYRIERRKGFLESAFLTLPGLTGRRTWKPSYFALAEGALFPPEPGRTTYGCLLTLAADGLPFRPRVNGLGFVVPGVFSEGAQA